MVLAGRRILVTGAATGIGRAIAVACAAAGARVGVHYHRSGERARALCDELGASSVPIGFDVVDAEAVARGVGEFVERTGGIDGLVNNAGINRPSLLVTATDTDILAMAATNFLGTIACTRAVLPTMLRQRSGVIVNISSVAAERPSRGQAVYAATKGGIEAFTRAVAIEYARKGIRCVAIRPGAVDTAMLAATKAVAGDEVLATIPLRRIAAADEIAPLAVYLLSDDASFVTGSIHAIDGGVSAS